MNRFKTEKIENKLTEMFSSTVMPALFFQVTITMEDSEEEEDLCEALMEIEDYRIETCEESYRAFSFKSNSDKLTQIAVFKYSTPLSRGNDGEVFEIDVYTFDTAQNKFQLKTGKDKLVKVFQNVDEAKVQQIEKEFRTIRQIKGLSLGAKKPVYATAETVNYGHEQGRKTAYLVMNRLKGLHLAALLKSGKIQELSWEQKLKLCLKIALAYQTQLVGSGFVHRDIHFENILFYLETFEANFIDFGLSVSQLELIRECVGNKLCASPEAFSKEQGHAGYASDIFSLARVFVTLLKSGDAAFLQKELNKKRDEEYYRLALDASELLALPSLPIVKKTLKQMLAEDPLARPGIEAIIEAFKEQLLAVPTLSSSTAALFSQKHAGARSMPNFEEKSGQASQIAAFDY